MANVYNFNDNVVTVKYFEGKGERQLVTGKETMLVKNVLHPGFPDFKHAHPHEQITLIVSGRCEFMLDGETFEMGVGDMVVIPGNVEHNISVLGDEPAVVYDIFSPIREDFIKLAEEAEKK